MLEDLLFKGEDPLKVLKSWSNSVLIMMPIVFVLWSMVGLYNWAT